ncbi:hypothetical protein [Planktotalea sp.]|uniref:hypothetical protein n=1 Tax=Planktotalea sp. TaxID=2029877 RepID=UPI003D6BC58B
MNSIRPNCIAFLSLIGIGLFIWRAMQAIYDLLGGDETGFLVFPLAVILPALAFGFLTTRRDMRSQEGALMQLGAMLQLLLIVAIPNHALLLTLGFPVVFLCVELFETKAPNALRTTIKRMVLR